MMMREFVGMTHGLPQHARGRMRLLPGALLVALAIFQTACRSDRSENEAARLADEPRTRVLIIGVDGLEWDVIFPLMREGRMPNLERLMQRGAFGLLETFPPAFSPAVWTTVATGKMPDKHGIDNFFKPGPPEKPVFYTSRDRRTKALWNILTDHGRSITTIGWWNTFPAEPVRGMTVAQTNTYEEFQRRRLGKGGLLRGIDGQVYPAGRQDEMLEIFEQVDAELPRILIELFGEVGVIRGPLNRAAWDSAMWAVRSDEAYRRIANKLARERPLPDCFAVYFGTPDVVGHRFWRFHEPEAFKHPPHDDALKKFRNVIRDAYTHTDQVIGELIDLFPPDTHIFVLSDHGMHATNQDVDFSIGTGTNESGAHTDGPPGIIVAAGPLIQPHGPKHDPTAPSSGVGVRGLSRDDLPVLGSVRDITPTILTLLGLPIGRDMDGDFLAGLFGEGADELQVAYVATHDTPEWFASRGDEIEVIAPDERVEQLRALGYLGGDETAPPTTRPAGHAPARNLQ